jgi:hypothetical protein
MQGPDEALRPVWPPRSPWHLMAGFALAQETRGDRGRGHPLYAEIDEPRVKFSRSRPVPGEGYEVRLQGRVNAYGLDLTDPQDEAVFRARVSNVAWDLCQRIGEAYPRTQPDTETCAKKPRTPSPRRWRP